MKAKAHVNCAIRLLLRGNEGIPPDARRIAEKYEHIGVRLYEPSRSISVQATIRRQPWQRRLTLARLLHRQIKALPGAPFRRPEAEDCLSMQGDVAMKYICLLALAALLGTASGVHAQSASLVGMSSYVYYNNVATLAQDRVDYDCPFGYVGYSGTLRLELWAFDAPYRSGMAGYRLAVHSLGQLECGHYWYNITSGAIPFSPPPNGRWYFSLLLQEYDNGYVVVDYLNFDGVETFGAPPAPPPPPPDPAYTAVEYYHAGFGHYFVTAFTTEIQQLDSGAFAGWSRTGQTFNVWAMGATNTQNVCRFFSTSFAPRSSHFYTPFTAECQSVKGNPNWQFEGTVFAVRVPDAVGNCPSGARPLFRLYNNGRSGAPNHRYTTNTSVRQTMVAQGWTPEGHGSLGVVACVPY